MADPDACRIALGADGIHHQLCDLQVGGCAGAGMAMDHFNNNSGRADD